MPAPSPQSPPQPSEPPNHPTPRLSRARRLSSRSHRTTSSPHQSPVSSDRTWQTSVHNRVRRQLLPSSSSARSRSPSPVPAEESTLDEDLKDPDHFIRAFSALSGPLLHISHKFYEKLERYLVKVNLSPEHPLYMPGTGKDARGGVSNVNFAEAALVVQGSTRIYGKKVDLLFDAAINLFRLLSAPFEEEDDEEEGEEGGEASATPRTPRGTKRPRLALENRDLAEDILAVDTFREGKRIELRRTAQQRFSDLVKNLAKRPIGNIRLLPPNIPRLVRKTKALGTNLEETERINIRRVPQFGQGLEGRGYIDEYRLNEVVRGPDTMLVDHVIPVVKEPQVSAVAEESPTTVSKTSQQVPINHCDSGIDSCPSSVYNPVENIGAQDYAWEGNSVAPTNETDAISLADDGFLSEGAHEEGVSELEEESEPVVSKEVVCEIENEERTVGVDPVMSEHERSGTESSGIFSEAVHTDQESHATEDEREAGGDAVTCAASEDGSANKETIPQVSSPALKEADFVPIPRRNKRKMKNFKLPCKLSLLLPEKKKRFSRGNRAAALWRPSQSPCSSTSSNYPQSPMSYTAASPDHHSLNLLLQDDEPHIPLDALSDSDNEGEYFDPLPDGQPQVNHWIRNHQKDLMSAGQEVTLSDRVAQWQELIMPRLDANLEHGPYSHLKYAPILMELVSRNGWPPPRLPASTPDSSIVEVDLCDSEDELIFPLDWKDRRVEVRDKASLEESRCTAFIPYDTDFVEPRECDEEWGGENFFGFKSVKKIKRRGVVLVPESEENQGRVKNLFSVISKNYNWGMKEDEQQVLSREEEMDKWLSNKRKWLQSRVGVGRPRRRNWDEWTEEDDNIEVNHDMDVSALRSGCSTTGPSDPVHFTTVFSGFRKEEVSRLLFTALHLASQGHMEITSAPGEINSMKVTLLSSTSR